MSACVVGKNIPHLVHFPASAHCTVHTLLQVHTAHLQRVQKSHSWFRFNLQTMIFYFLQYWTMLSFVPQVNTKIIVSVNCFQVNEIKKCPKQASRMWLNLSPINVWFLISPIDRGGKRQESRKKAANAKADKRECIWSYRNCIRIDLSFGISRLYGASDLKELVD